MEKILKRYKYSDVKKYNKLIFIYKNKNYKIDLKKNKKKFNIEGIIKFLPYEFIKLKKVFYHFNFQHSYHVKNKKYLILRINKKGFFKKNNTEKIPNYSSKKIYLYKCFYSKNFVKYRDIKDKFLKKCLETTNTKNKLFKTIKKRYNYLLDIYSEKQIYDSGVAITGLKYIKSINFEELNEKRT